MSIPKSKLLVVGTGGGEDLQPIIVQGETMDEVVSNFRCLVGLVEVRGEVLMDVEDRIARVSRAFGALCRPVLKDRNLSLRTKRMVYRAVILGVLLYGAETWVNKSAATQKLESFNSKCILGITRTQQRKYNLTTVQVRRRLEHRRHWRMS